MTQEEKNILLKDLCARLPYKVKLDFYSSATNEHFVCTLLGINPEDNKPVVAKVNCGNFLIPQEHIKPYLRPMSSMTEEEEDEYKKLIDCSDYTSFTTSDRVIDWLYSHNFDFRGFIPMGLALEAKEGMYNN